MTENSYQVVWQGIVHDQQGYARASREYLLGLDRAGVDVKIEPLNFGTPSARIDPEQAKRIKELINKPKSETKKKILIYHAQPYGVNPDKERANGYDKVIINTVWETTKVPSNWFPFINQADAVVVPSSQNVQALIDSGVTVPIFKVPHGADTNAFNPDNDKYKIHGLDDTFKFLSVFQWQHRKCPDKLLKAFWSEFTAKDDVALIVKSYWGNDALKADQRYIINTIYKYKDYLGFGEETAPIYYSGSLFSDHDLKGLYTMSDVFVLPSRGEGVGLPYIEAMSSGIPCIATSWGGQTDFINNDNGYLIDCDLKPTTASNETAIAQNFFHLFTDDMLWAEADIEHLQKLMRHTFENREEVKVKGKSAREDMERMTWNDAGHIFKESIERML